MHLEKKVASFVLLLRFWGSRCPVLHRIGVSSTLSFRDQPMQIKIKKK